MSLTRDDTLLMNQLMSEDRAVAQTVEDAGQAVIVSLRKSGVKCAGDDRRAALDAAIYRYVLACKG